MRVFQKGLKTKAMVLSLTAMLCAGSAFAANTNLSEIKISSAPNNGYNITLKTDTNTSYKTSLKDDTKLIVELKNTVPSENLSTIYNEVPSINNVSVMDLGKDSLKIEILGNHVDKSTINIEPSNMMPAQSLLATFYQNKTNKTLWGSILALGAIILTSRKRKSKNATSNQACSNAVQKAQRELELAQELNKELKKPQSLRAKITRNDYAPSINYARRSFIEPNTTTSPIKPVKQNIINYPQNKRRKSNNQEYAYSDKIIGMK